MKLMPILVLALLAFVGNAGATDYYLATTGSNGNTGLSIAQAWLTPSYSVQQIGAGDTLWVVDGTYYDSTTSKMYAENMGAESNWVYIKAYNGTPIWDGGGTQIIGLELYYTSIPYSTGYIEMDGITIQNYGYAEVLIRYMSNVTLKNCTFKYSSVPDSCSIIDIGEARDITIDNCSFYDAGDFCLNIMGDRYGTADKTYDISVTDCDFEKTVNHPALQVSDYASDVTITGNTFSNCYGGMSFYSHNLSRAMHQSNIVIEDNTFTNLTYGALYFARTIDSYASNNIVDGAGSSAFTIYGHCNNLTVKDSVVNDSRRIHDDYDANHANVLAIYENISYTNITEVNTYYVRAGGNITVRADAHTPSFRVEMDNAELTGNASIEYTDGRVFGYSIDLGTTYSMTLPAWYPTGSNFTFGSGAGVSLDVDVIPYNITLMPANARLQNVTVAHEANTTYDLTNITVNSSVATNPTWINATMQNASNTYNISIDGVYASQVQSDTGGVVRYQYTSSWSSHDFEIEWHSIEGEPWNPSIFGNYYNIANPIEITTKAYGDKSNIFSRTPTESDELASFSIEVTV